MKSYSNNLLESLDYDDVKNLTSEVKETLSPHFKKEINKNFTAVELWNIHRQRKNANGRKFYE